MTAAESRPVSIRYEGIGFFLSQTLLNSPLTCPKLVFRRSRNQQVKSPRTMSNEIITTFEYSSLEGPRDIRLLKISTNSNDQSSAPQTYRLVHAELPEEGSSNGLSFETVSYTWGDSTRVSTLRLSDEHGSIVGEIGLTANLTQAIPHLTDKSKTRLLWIDQLCINQGDDLEKGVQVGMMDQIYKSASRVLIWLGLVEEDSRMVKQWLDTLDRLLPLQALEGLLPRQQDPAKFDPANAAFRPDNRAVWVDREISKPDNASTYAAAIFRFLHRPWFSRGWIVQELLLSTNITFVIGDTTLNKQNMKDLFATPHGLVPDDNTTGSNGSYRTLMTLKFHPFTEEQPLRFFRLMAQASAEFSTFSRRDQLYAFLGMIPGLCPDFFKPDQTCPIHEAFAKFVVAVSRKHGSLDFLSLCSTWQDNFLRYKPELSRELAPFPTWVPSWTSTPLQAPFRLATGGVRGRDPVAWNAAAGRKHVYREIVDDDPATSSCLLVRGRIVDRVHSVSTATFQRTWDADHAYLDGLVDEIKGDLQGLQHWSKVDLVDFLNKVAWNGVCPKEIFDYKTAEELLQAPANSVNLGLALAMARGRRFMRSQKGRTGLVPKMGTTWMSLGAGKGSVIAVLHGCSVPVVLERQEGDRKNVFKLVGDCYVEGIMHGETVIWNKDEAEEFVLI